MWRPRRLLLFVNPFGGKRNALDIYEKHARPTFQLARIDVELVVTQRAQQIPDILRNHSLHHYDGIVCVGGDGTFAELFNGILGRTMDDSQTKTGHDPRQLPATALPTPILPLGIIPAGSTDTIAYCMHGTNDIQTAVLNCCLGAQNGLDLCSVWTTDGKLLRFYASVLSYGYLGDVAADSERYRWMGPKRYDFSGFKKFLVNRGYEAEITVHMQPNSDADDDDDNDVSANPLLSERPPGCYAGCARCNRAAAHRTHASSSTSVKDAQTKSIRGKYFMINTANISCACERCPNGFSKYCHMGDGCFDLVLIRRTSFLNNVRLLLRLSSRSGNIVSRASFKLRCVTNVYI